jgi:hypothetical protein
MQVSSDRDGKSEAKAHRTFGRRRESTVRLPNSTAITLVKDRAPATGYGQRGKIKFRAVRARS